jgi:6,7-dimethyl-8-ribityllumazine synthase
MTTAMQTIEGNFATHANAQFRIALLASRFNELIVKELISGSQDWLVRTGVQASNITLVRVPGAYELSHIAREIALSGKVDGIVALGCIIRGDTAHFEFVAQAANAGLQQVSATTSVPVSFGVLTVESLDQALARAGSKAGNKGAEAAQALLEVLNLKIALRAWSAA